MYLQDKAFNPGVETKADPFSLEALIAWLRTKPAAERYNYHDCAGRCLISQFLSSHGLHPINDYLRAGNAFLENTGVNLDDLACDYPQTFGAALSRAEALQTNSKG